MSPEWHEVVWDPLSSSPRLRLHSLPPIPPRRDERRDRLPVVKVPHPHLPVITSHRDPPVLLVDGQRVCRVLHRAVASDEFPLADRVLFYLPVSRGREEGPAGRRDARDIPAEAGQLRYRLS